MFSADNNVKARNQYSNTGKEGKQDIDESY